MRRYRVRAAAGVTLDLDLIEEYLVQTYQGLGDDTESAMRRAAGRIGEALLYIRTFVEHPHRGTIHPEIGAGIRTVTENRFIFYFQIDEALFEVRILAVFFGGIDHRTQIVQRLKSSPIP